ncbi:MAG: ATP-binding protein [Deltaproteobacteria bacterium]
MKNDIFKRLIVDFQEKELSNVIDREISIPLDISKIISLVGVRRCGKTHILYSLINSLRKNLDRRNIVYINLEDDRVFPLQSGDLATFLDAYYELYPAKKNETVYFFFDEIQNAPHWEKFVRRLYDTENCRVYITGSSAKLLSKEIATALRGRTLTYEIFPLSFREFLKFKGISVNLHSSGSTANIKNALAEYVLKGGFPETVGLSEDIFIRTLQEYLDLIMYRDVVERYNVTNTFLLKFLFKYCFANFSTAISFNKLYNDFRSQGLQLSKNTVYEYISYLEDAYALFTVPIYSSSIREGMRNPKKLYSVDTGFKRVVDMPLANDIGRVYENIVFLQLRRSVRDIFYFKGKQEVDFYYVKAGVKHLVNVCYDPGKPATRQREVKGLIEAMKFLNLSEGYIITSELEEEIQEEGKTVRLLPLWKWLLSEVK